MPSRTVKKDKVYGEVLQLIEDAKKGGKGCLYYYSVSGCFGFYTQGMHVFCKVVEELKNLPTHPELETKLLIDFQKHPIDMFALRRMRRYLKRQFSCVRALKSDVAHSVSVDQSVGPHGIYHNCMFYLVSTERTKRLIVTHHMRKVRHEVLGFEIEEVEPAEIFEGDGCGERLDAFKRFFDKVYENSKPPKIGMVAEFIESIGSERQGIKEIFDSLTIAGIGVLFGIASGLVSLGWFLCSIMPKK